MGETVEQGGGHLGIAEDVGPFGEVQVGGDGEAGVFVQLADQVEQQGTAGLREWQVAQFVEDHQIGADQPFGQLPLFAGCLLQFQGIDQFDGGEEAHASVLMLDSLHADGRGQMGLAGAGAPDEDQVLLCLHELAAMQLSQQGFVYGTLAEVEVAQVGSAGSGPP